MLQEVAETDARANEDDASIRTCKIEGCCAKRCTNNFTLDELLQYNFDSRNLDYYSEGTNILDLVILGEIRGMSRSSDSVKRGNSIVTKERERNRMMYMLRGIPVCEKLYLLSHSIKIKRFKRLMKHYKGHGISPPIHGNFKRTPKSTIKHETVDKIVSFIRNYAEESALFMPGRLASQYNIVKLLPSSDNKSILYRKYKDICIANDEIWVSGPAFRKIWNTFCADIVIMKPKTDLCELCQRNYTSHGQLRGVSDEEKSAFFEKCQEHLRRVATERAAYKSVIKDTVKYFEDHKNELHIENERHVPNSYNGNIHYSFDFAQQIHIPFNTLQPGPIYFLTPFKVGLFGIMNDTVKVQHNFVIPESCSVAKGANAIVSYLHHYLEHHGLGEKNLYLHADNCVAQNKNNIVTCYLAWRIINKLHTNITLSFLPVGHTKFACDWAFGLLKKKVRVGKASCLADVVEIISNSTPVSKVNRSVLTGNEQGDVYVKMNDWLGYFASKKWKAIKNITTYNHFSFKSGDEHVGKVTCQMTIGGPAVTLTITSDTGIIEDHPTEIVPEGLSWKRKNYLFQKIRPYCDEAHKDLLCPDPGPEPIASKPTNEEVLPELEEEEEILLTPKPRKRARKQQIPKPKAAQEPGTSKKKKK